ncbi:flagellar basal body rod modification protein [Clostridium liquoris]|jgi:flagellar basal-body rod modification protein FlgD|uniref:Flagellar basal body rod modification protein n=1 Tax=Clostridium liquoris TaxID=1289519 RepID=A0A2T0B1V4_9CLOT|nr:flagellar hook capping FlgD N-terminal domain-containing protein [Clostridium liquoris]PRR77530.1 flagellar basal body rod modification protein [Clostridium liquoris]
MPDNTSIIQKTNNINASTRTNRGTTITKPGQEMDKNVFLRILSAELANQDPTNAKDGTEYVAQMAQFAALEQMTNLNSSMRFIGASSLIGKVVMVNKADENGNPYFGKVSGVSKDGSIIKINVAVGEEKDENGSLVPIIKQFSIDDILEVINMPEENNTPADGGDSGDNGDSVNSGENSEKAANSHKENNVSV